MIKRINLILITLCLTIGCEKYDVVIRNGMIYDGYGFEPYVGDVALKGDKVALIKEKISAKGKTEIDATGLAVSPGFINMLSWATISLIRDGRSLSDIKQGVTLEVFGEGSSMGPLNERMKERQQNNTDDYTIDWTTLGEYLESLEGRGVSTNVASFIGATTLRAVSYTHLRAHET